MICVTRVFCSRRGRRDSGFPEVSENVCTYMMRRGDELESSDASSCCRVSGIVCARLSVALSGNCASDADPGAIKKRIGNKGKNCILMVTCTH